MLEQLKEKILDEYKIKAMEIIREYKDEVEEIDRLSMHNSVVSENNVVKLEQSVKNNSQTGIDNNNISNNLDDNNIGDDNNNIEDEVSIPQIHFSSEKIGFVSCEPFEDNDKINENLVSTTSGEEPRRKLKIKSAKTKKNGKRILDNLWYNPKRRKLGYEMLKVEVDQKELEKTELRNMLKEELNSYKNDLFNEKLFKLLNENNDKIEKMQKIFYERQKKEDEYRIMQEEIVKNKEEQIKNQSLLIEDLTRKLEMYKIKPPSSKSKKNPTNVLTNRQDENGNKFDLKNSEMKIPKLKKDETFSKENRITFSNEVSVMPLEKSCPVTTQNKNRVLGEKSEVISKKLVSKEQPQKSEKLKFNNKSSGSLDLSKITPMQLYK